MPPVSERVVPEAGRRIGLVLGAGGPAGGAWTRGCFAALEETTGFRPSMASTLVGTSIGAFIAGRTGPPEPAPRAVVEALQTIAEPPSRPSTSDRVIAAGRLSVGRAICAVKPPGRDDALGWVQHIEPGTLARVVSARCRRGTRRAELLADSSDPTSEIAASGAIPLGARPVSINGADHIDGAVLSVTNADLIDPSTVDVLIVIAPLVSTGTGGSLVSRSGRRQLRTELAAAARHATPTAVFAPSGSEYERRQERERHEQVGRSMLSQPLPRW